MDGNKAFEKIGRAAGVLLATAAIGGTAGYSCIMGVAVGMNNLKNFEIGAAEHAGAVREIVNAAANDRAEELTQPETKPATPETKQAPATPETKPATRSTSRGTGPTMTAQNDEPGIWAQNDAPTETPRTFAAIPPEDPREIVNRPQTHRSFTYKPNCVAIQRKANDAAGAENNKEKQ